MPGPGNKKAQGAARLSLQVGRSGRIPGICQDDRFQNQDRMHQLSSRRASEGMALCLEVLHS